MLFAAKSLHTAGPVLEHDASSGFTLYADISNQHVLMRMINAEYGLAMVSIPFVLITMWELSRGKIMWYASDTISKCLLTFGFSVPSWILVWMLLSIDDPQQNPSKMTDNIVLFITVVNNIVGNYFAAACLVRISSPEDPYLKPRRMAFLTLCNAIYSLLNLWMDFAANPNEDPAVAQHTVYALAALFSTSTYVAVALGLASTAQHFREAYFPEKNLGIAPELRTYHVDIAATIVTAIAVFGINLAISGAGGKTVYSTPDISGLTWSRFESLKMGYIIYLEIFSLYVLFRVAKEKEVEALRAERENATRSATVQRLVSEKALLDKVLCSLVPARVAHDLSLGKPVAPEAFDFCAIFFSDIVGFTPFARKQSPLEVFDMLNRLYSVMDHCVSQWPSSLYKVETIGDGRCAVSQLRFSKAIRRSQVLTHSLSLSLSLSLTPLERYQTPDSIYGRGGYSQ